MRDKLAAAVADPVGAGLDAFGKRIASKTQRWGDLICNFGIRWKERLQLVPVR